MRLDDGLKFGMVVNYEFYHCVLRREERRRGGFGSDKSG